MSTSKLASEVAQKNKSYLDGGVLERAIICRHPIRCGLIVIRGLFSRVLGNLQVSVSLLNRCQWSDRLSHPCSTVALIPSSATPLNP
ncbi:unnamed protein product [Fusarium graminearum]|uniref:Uncharacterized protein n=1 Tax=Gibberella zeae TaxID=5518 RepID=A0A4E9ECI9_GIBZA|nr:unnamed protein product [Fusarium graminearum]CAF3630424.1 unnamed protein product [Fusarium graminearum]CAG1973852.1 unnamed protein product [Fusarium graminearum]CAG1993372.1 unnamed protein product [Fusarium graminearum]